MFLIFSETLTQPGDVGNPNVLQRPFKCDFPNCTKAFKTKSALNQHKKKHTNSNTVSCRICNKIFSEKDLLIQHLNHFISKYGKIQPRNEHANTSLSSLTILNAYKKELQKGYNPELMTNEDGEGEEEDGEAEDGEEEKGEKEKGEKEMN